MRVLINATNLHSGGGLQVASSFIYELSKIIKRGTPHKFIIFVSTEVHASLMDLDFKVCVFNGYEVLDVTAFKSLMPSVRRKFDGYDLVFTIFGPMYFLRGLKNHLVGFAQPWIIYPDNLLRRKIPLLLWIIYKIKYEIQWFFFKRSSYLLVELEHVKERLITVRNFPSSKISIVKNCVSPVFRESSLWKNIKSELIKSEEAIKIGYLCRDYPHKNVDFLADVAERLQKISKIKYRFYVTLNQHEWDGKSKFFKKLVKNFGELRVAECPKFYQELDAVIFPSLLECYSATPIESFAMKLPVFASDLDFVHDCCHDHAIYFDPLDANSAALAIDRWFSYNSQEERKCQVELAYNYFCSLDNSRKRAKSYLALIESFSNTKGI